MLANFIFSLNAVVPLFFIILLGFALKKSGFIGAEFFSIGTKVVFYIAIPFLMFRSVYNTDQGDLLDLPFIAFVVTATFIGFIVIWAAAAVFIKDKRILGAFVQGSFRGNIAFLGLPLMYNIAGDVGVARAALVITVCMPVFNICSIFVLSVCSGSGEKIKLKTVILTIIKTPLIIGIALGVLFVLLGIRLPSMLDNTVNQIANMATPMALFCLGGGIALHGFDKKFKFAVIAGAIKVIALPIVFVAAAYAFGFRGIDLAAIMMLGGTPAAIAGYITVVQMGGDGYTAGTIVLTSTAMSAVTLTLFIYVLRVMGLIG